MGWYSSTYNPLHGMGWLRDPDDICLTAKTIRRTKEAPLHYIHSFEVPGPFAIPSRSRLFPPTSLSLHCTWGRLFPLFFFLGFVQSRQRYIPIDGFHFWHRCDLPPASRTTRSFEALSWSLASKRLTAVDARWAWWGRQSKMQTLLWPAVALPRII